MTPSKITKRGALIAAKAAVYSVKTLFRYEVFYPAACIENAWVAAVRAGERPRGILNTSTAASSRARAAELRAECVAQLALRLLGYDAVEAARGAIGEGSAEARVKNAIANMAERGIK